jgi:hypothetical protein
MDLWGKYLAEELPAVYAEQTATVVIFISADYTARDWTRLEHRAALTRAVRERREYVLPARFDDTPIPGPLADMVTIDLRGHTPQAFADLLVTKLTALGVLPTAPMTAPVSPVFPDRLPTVFTVPSRNRYFTGREDLLTQLRAGLTRGTAVAVTALHGLGGVGKTQLAIEYAHRYAAGYRMVGWIDAEQSVLIGEQLATLASRVGLPVTGQVREDAAAMLGWLRRHANWLLIFDNACQPAGLHPWLSDGPGHTMITSRYPGWGNLADPLDVDVLSRVEAITLLTRRIPRLDPAIARELAQELGDLPLALEQAAAYLDTTRLSPSDYLRKFRRRRAQMLDRGHDLAYGGSIATVWSLALDQLRSHHSAAVTLLDLCAHLGPEPIPLTLFTTHPDLLDPPLRDVIADTDPTTDVDDTLGAILAYSLARRTDDTIQLHRLVAAVIRAHQPLRPPCARRQPCAPS